MTTVPANPGRPTDKGRFMSSPASITLCVALAASLGVTARADVAPVTEKGHNLFVRPDTTVQMQAEDVVVTLFRSHAVVTATFDMYNTGRAATFTVGFPTSVSRERIKQGDMAWDAGLQDFKLWVNGKERFLPHPKVKEGKTPPFITWKQRFDAGKTSRIRVSYWVSTHSGFDRRVDPKTRKLVRGAERVKRFRYVLLTGAGWKGPIGRASITVDLRHLDSPVVYGVNPWGFRYADSKIQWTLPAFEPTEYFLADITISYFEGRSKAREVKGAKPVDLQAVAKRDWRSAAGAIDRIARDRSVSAAQRIDKLRDFAWVAAPVTFDWRVRRHAFAACRKLSAEVAKDPKAVLSNRACWVLGMAQCTQLIPKGIEQLTTGAGHREKSAALVYLWHLYAPEMAEPLVDWVVRQKDDHGLLGRVGGVISKCHTTVEMSGLNKVEMSAFPCDERANERPPDDRRVDRSCGSTPGGSAPRPPEFIAFADTGRAHPKRRLRRNNGANACTKGGP